MADVDVAAREHRSPPLPPSLVDRLGDSRREPNRSAPEQPSRTRIDIDHFLCGTTAIKVLPRVRWPDRAPVILGRVDAALEWWANRSFLLGPFPVVVEDVRTGRLRDMTHLEGLRQTHGLDPAFTLRFEDDSTIEVVGRPDDEGRFALSALEDTGTGEFTETDDVALTAAWLTEHGFVNTQSTSSSGGNGSRLFERNDGWEVRCQRVLGAWTLELKPPQGTYVDFSRVRVRTTEPCWRQELPELITMLAPR